MQRIVKVGFFLVLSILCLPGTLWTHPHAFADCTLDVVFDENGIRMIHENWVMDEMFSNVLIWDFDTNEDGALTGTELDAVAAAGMENLQTYSYFTHLWVNGKAVVTEARNMRCDWRDGRLIYDFDVPVTTTPGGELVVSIYDDSFYTDIYVLDDGIRYSGQNAKFSISMDRRAAPELSYYNGQVTPDAIFLKVAGK